MLKMLMTFHLKYYSPKSITFPIFYEFLVFLTYLDLVFTKDFFKELLDFRKQRLFIFMVNVVPKMANKRRVL